MINWKHEHIPYHIRIHIYIFHSFLFFFFFFAFHFGFLKGGRNALPQTISQIPKTNVQNKKKLLSNIGKNVLTFHKKNKKNEGIVRSTPPHLLIPCIFLPLPENKIRLISMISFVFFV